MSLDFSLSVESCAHCGRGGEYVFDCNITHNLNSMADEAGIYECLWRPQENGYIKAKDIVEKLETGLRILRKDPSRFKKHNPPNGWGSYEGFVKAVESCLEACKSYPDASIYASR